MNTDDFKKLLRESIESDGENWINEIRLSQYPSAIGVQWPYRMAWKLAFHRFVKAKKEKYEKENPGSDIVFSPVDDQPGNAEYAAAKKEFRNILKSLGIDKNMDLRKWEDIHTNFHKKYYRDPSSNKNASDALHNYIASRKKEETSGGEDKFKRSLKYALHRYDQEYQSIGNHNTADIKEKFKQDLDVFISPQGNLKFDPKKWKEIYDEYHKANEVFLGDKVSDAIHNYVLKKRGHEDEESKEEFRSKGIGKELEPKLQKAIENIKAASQKPVTADKFEILLKYYALGKYYNKPESLETITKSFRMWTDKLIDTITADEKVVTIQVLWQEMINGLKKSHLYNQPHKLLTTLLEKDKLQELNLINTTLDNMGRLNMFSATKKKINQMIAAGGRARARMSEQEELSEG